MKRQRLEIKRKSSNFVAIMIAIWIFIGLFVGCLAVYLVMRGRLQSDIALKDKELALTKQELAAKEQELAANVNRCGALEQANMKLGNQRADLAGRLAVQQELVEQIRKEAKSQREESDAQWQLKFDKLREELANVAHTALAAKQSTLQETNRKQIDELLKPIAQQFEQFRKAVDESRTSGEVAKKELKDAFAATMKLFEQQQNNTVEALRRETTRIGEDASNLTRALKRDSKVQGDWGEMILDTLLESSGLERDVHYFIQENVKDEDGKNRRPDVVVRFPEKRAIIIDSKVSIKAYVESFEAEDETERQRKLREHAKSVRRHVDELAEKKYDELVDDSISFVLMFIPNDQCYLTAMEQDKQLGSYAFNKGIVIISPSNLMIALQLSYNMWQKDRQNKNIEEIVKEATAIYDKAAIFTETFLRAESQLSTVAKTFAQARGQLYDGKGNFLTRLEGLKSKGLTPKKGLKGLADTATDQEEYE